MRVYRFLLEAIACLKNLSAQSGRHRAKEEDYVANMRYVDGLYISKSSARRGDFPFPTSLIAMRRVLAILVNLDSSKTKRLNGTIGIVSAQCPCFKEIRQYEGFQLQFLYNVSSRKDSRNPYAIPIFTTSALQPHRYPQQLA